MAKIIKHILTDHIKCTKVENLSSWTTSFFSQPDVQKFKAKTAATIGASQHELELARFHASMRETQRVSPYQQMEQARWRERRNTYGDPFTSPSAVTELNTIEEQQRLQMGTMMNEHSAERSEMRLQLTRQSERIERLNREMRSHINLRMELQDIKETRTWMMRDIIIKSYEIVKNAVIEINPRHRRKNNK